MLENIYNDTLFKRTVTDFPTGAHDHNSCRALLKRVVAAFELFLDRAPMRIAVDCSTGNPQGVDSLAIYDVEDNRTSLVPVKLSKATITIGGELMFVAHARAVPLLARKIIDLISTMQAGEVVA